MIDNVGSLFLRHFLSFCSCTTLNIFKKCSVSTLWFCFLPSSEEESLYTLLKRQQ